MAQLSQNLFIGIFPGGISYCDRTQEEHGDYKRVAFLPYDTLELRVNDPKSALLPLVKADAAEMQAKRGEQFAIDCSGHTVLLGGR